MPNAGTGGQMVTPPDETAADPYAVIAALREQLTECSVQRDEALGREAALAEVMDVINHSPGNLAHVLDAILEKAMRLCGAAFGSLYTYDGERFQSAAQRGVPP